MFALCKINGTLNVNQLKELVFLLENQNTTDKYRDTSLDINGDYAHIQVKINKSGDVEFIE